MAKDEREEEREFLDGLKARTGRDLAAWMAAITTQGFADKNETIDWLRSEGFPFARASWLERIHSNGGKPIYADSPTKQGTAPQPAPPSKPPLAKPSQQPLSSSDAASLEKLISAAKGYRPLYHLLEAEVRKALPDVAIAPRAGYLSLGAPAEFAALTLHATELRLGLDLGDRGFDAHLQKARLKGPGPAITHMVVLTDARQVNGNLLALLETANLRVNS
jgi:Domain of unknown function (DUF5655)